MRSPGVSLKSMCRGIHKVRTGKGEERPLQKRAPVVLVTPLLCYGAHKREGGGQKFDLFGRTQFMNGSYNIIQAIRQTKYS